MTSLLRHSTTFIWLLLLVVTGAAWLLADDADITGSAVAWLSSGLVALAFFKVRLVGLHFMDLRYAPLPLRILFEIWVVGTCAAVMAIYVLIPSVP